MQSGISQKIASYFKCLKGISAVYLFGSEAKGTSNRLSDVDVGILFERNQAPSFEEKTRLQEELSALLKKDVDLVVLNSANPILNHQVLKNGVLLLSPKPRDVHAFFIKTVMEYDDLKRMRAYQEQQLLRGISHGR